jgi:hypothetical protein
MHTLKLSNRELQEVEGMTNTTASYGINKHNNLKFYWYKKTPRAFSHDFELRNHLNITNWYKKYII